ncbi:MAG: hypothetical protein KGH65_01745 [Candidatus Micrarchaeota archaeon]|nr:hypothetical protein [Candidatus Micrarchaeota archaeon]
MNTKPFFAITASFVLSSLLLYLNQSSNLLLGIMLISIATLSCSIYFLCDDYLRSTYSKRLKESSLVDSLFQLLHYRSKGNNYQRSLSYIIESSTIPEMKAGFQSMARQIRLGRSLGESLESLFDRHTLNSNLNFSQDDVLHSGLRKFLALHSKAKERSSSIALDSLQRGSTVNMFLSTLLPSFLLFIFVGTSVISPSQTGLLFISVMVLIVVPSLYALSSTVFSRRLIVETI